MGSQRPDLVRPDFESGPYNIGNPQPPVLRTESASSCNVSTLETNSVRTTEFQLLPKLSYTERNYIMLFNKARAVEYMHRCQVDVLVATSSVNVTYFSDYYSWLGFAVQGIYDGTRRLKRS